MRQNLYSPPVLMLAMVFAAGKMGARQNLARPDVPLTLLSFKEAARQVLDHPAPEYPPVAKVNYLQGQVLLELTVNGHGKVESAHVLEGDAVLAVAAMNAALRWTYRPLTKAAGPSGFVTRARVKFILNYQGVDLSPQQAERDFLRQVQPPQVERRPADAPRGELCHMRLLVNDEGKVVDEEISRAEAARFMAAREALQGWSFRPAHWGTLPIASYFEVDVPVRISSIAQAAGEIDGR